MIYTIRVPARNVLAIRIAFYMVEYLRTSGSMWSLILRPSEVERCVLNLHELSWFDMIPFWSCCGMAGRGFLRLVRYASVFYRHLGCTCTCQWPLAVHVLRVRKLHVRRYL